MGTLAPVSVVVRPLTGVPELPACAVKVYSQVVASTLVVLSKVAAQMPMRGSLLAVTGLTEKDISPVSMTPEAVPAAMASGQLPVGVTYEPSLSQILGQGGGKKFKVVFSSKDAPGLIADVLVFTPKAIAAKPTEISGIIKAYLDGMAYIKAKPDDAAKLIGKFMGVSAKEVKEQWSGVYNIPLAEMPKAFLPGKDTTSYHASGEVIGNLLKAKGQITALPPAEATFDGSIVKTLVK